MNFALVATDFFYSMCIWECLCMYICLYAYLRLCLDLDMCAFVRLCVLYMCMCAFFSSNSYKT